MCACVFAYVCERASVGAPVCVGAFVVRVYVCARVCVCLGAWV